jgi:hypothetical protein
LGPINKRPEALLDTMAVIGEEVEGVGEVADDVDDIENLVRAGGDVADDERLPSPVRKIRSSSCCTPGRTCATNLHYAARIRRGSQF